MGIKLQFKPSVSKLHVHRLIANNVVSFAVYGIVILLTISLTSSSETENAIYEFTIITVIFRIHTNRLST